MIGCLIRLHWCLMNIWCRTAIAVRHLTRHRQRCSTPGKGQKPNIASGLRHVRFTPKADMDWDGCDVRFVPKADILHCGNQC
jgi:hypothetical protein